MSNQEDEGDDPEAAASRRATRRAAAAASRAARKRAGDEGEGGFVAVAWRLLRGGGVASVVLGLFLVVMVLAQVREGQAVRGGLRYH